MSTTVGDVAVRVGANIDDLKKGMADGSKTIGDFASKSGPKLRKVATNLTKMGAAAVAAGASMAAALYVKGAQAVDEQGKLARALGGTSEGMQALARAGGRAGVTTEELRSASQRLNQRLGEAMIKGGAAADTLKLLGLRADQLSRMDVDQRMAAIAGRMKDVGMNTQEAAYHLRNLGIRQSSVITLMQDSAGAIEDSRKKINQYGIAISEVDSAKVEAANDAFDEMKIIADGVTKKFAVEMAPIVQAVSQYLVDAGVEAGGFGQIATRAADAIVRGFGYALDVFHGIRVAAKLVTAGFQGLGTAAITVASMVVEGWSRLFVDITAGVKTLIGVVNKIPGVNIPTDGIDNLTLAFANEAEAQAAMQAQLSASFAQTKSELQELAMMEMPSEKFKRFVDDAKAAAQEAAEAAVAARPEQESSEQGGLSEAEQKAMDDRLEKMRESFLTEGELLAEKYAADQELLVAALEAKRITEEEHNLMSQQLLAQHEDAMSAIAERAADARNKLAEQEAKHRQSVWKNAWTGLTSLMNSESRKLFEIGKAAAISQSIIATYQGMAEALKLGFPLGLAAAAAIGAKGFADVAAIRSQSFGSGGGAAGSATQQISGNTQPVQQQEQTTNYRFEGLSKGGIYSGDQIIDFLSKAEKDGALRGKLSFAA